MEKFELDSKETCQQKRLEYKLFHEQMNMTTAKVFCKNIGGKLPSIESAQEQLEVTATMQKSQTCRGL